MTVNGHLNMIINKNSASEPGYVIIVQNVNPVGIHWAVSFVSRVEWLRLKRGADLRTDWHRAELPYRYVPSAEFVHNLKVITWFSA